MANLRKSRFVALVTIIIGAQLAACSSGGNTTSGAGGAGTTSHAGSTSAASSGAGTGGAAAQPTFVAHFDPSMGQLPEGLFVDGQTAYVGWAALGKVEKIALPGGAITELGSIPAPPAMAGFMLGIVVDGSGNTYVGFGGGPGMTVKNGVYKIPASGGAVTAPWASDPAMNFPNGLVFDAQSNLFVADSGGFVFKITPAGAVSKWLANPVLVGSPGCMFAAPFPIGANGIVESGNAFYVSNTNVGSIVKVPILADGSAGTPSLFAGPDCSTLGGIDGIALDADGSILGLINSQNKIVRIRTDGKVSTLFAGAPLDNPASISVASASGGKVAYITNSALFDTKSPAPGLLSFPLH